jgi:hypothetical protein
MVHLWLCKSPCYHAKSTWFCTRFDFITEVKTEILILRDVPLYRFAFYLWRNRPNVAWSTSLLKFLDHTQLYTNTHPHQLGLLWTSDHLVADVATCTTHNKHKRWTSMSSAKFEPPIPGIKRLQTYTLGQMDTCLGKFLYSFRPWGKLQLPRTSYTLQTASFSVSWVNANSVSLHDNNSTRIWTRLLETLKSPFHNKILAFQSINVLCPLSFNGLFF